MFKEVFSVFILVFLSAGLALAKIDPAPEAEQQINVFSIAGYAEKGKKSWDLSARSADVFEDTVKLKEIVGNLYQDEENITLTADRGDFNKAKANVHLEQNVIVVTSSGAKLTTDSLDWDRKSQIVSTKNIVNIQRGNIITVAQGATGEPNLNKVKLDKDVKIQINPQANKITIACEGPVEIDYQKNIATFKKEVKVQGQDIQLYSDTMDAYFTVDKQNSNQAGQSLSSAGSKLEKIIAKGNVKIIRGENVSFSDEAVYIAADKKITLAGQPKLIIYSGEDLSASSGN